MRFLLDTHVFLWAFLSPEKLDQDIIDLLEDAENEKFFSAASAWEIAIKHRHGSIVLPFPPPVFIKKALAATDIKQLAITINDTLSAGELPPIHKDPFDRLLITQARHHELFIVTNDHVFEEYEVDIMDA